MFYCNDNRVLVNMNNSYDNKVPFNIIGKIKG